MAAAFPDDREDFGEFRLLELPAAEGIAADGAVERHFENHHDPLAVALVEPFVRRRLGVEAADFDALRAAGGNILADVVAVVGDVAVRESVLAAQKIGSAVHAELAVARLEGHEPQRLADRLENGTVRREEFRDERVEVRAKRPREDGALRRDREGAGGRGDGLHDGFRAVGKREPHRVALRAAKEGERAFEAGADGRDGGRFHDRPAPADKMDVPPDAAGLHGGAERGGPAPVSRRGRENRVAALRQKRGGGLVGHLDHEFGSLLRRIERDLEGAVRAEVRRDLPPVDPDAAGERDPFELEDVARADAVQRLAVDPRPGRLGRPGRLVAPALRVPGVGERDGPRVGGPGRREHPAVVERLHRRIGEKPVCCFRVHLRRMSSAETIAEKNPPSSMAGSGSPR